MPTETIRNLSESIQAQERRAYLASCWCFQAARWQISGAVSFAAPRGMCEISRMEATGYYRCAQPTVESPRHEIGDGDASCGTSSTTGRDLAGLRQPVLAFKPECPARLVNFCFLPAEPEIGAQFARVPGATELAILQPIALGPGHVGDAPNNDADKSQGLGIPGNRVLVDRLGPAVCVFPHGRSIEGP
jgi:hypothetical protein